MPVDAVEDAGRILELPARIVMERRVLDRQRPGAVVDHEEDSAAALTRVVYQRRDDGLIFSPNQSEQPLRRVRYDTRETMRWRNPQTGASLRVSYPAEQVVLTPVSFQ